MKFPGRRKSKHYFPVSVGTRPNLESDQILEEQVYIVGIDQLLVDIEASVSKAECLSWNIPLGESVVLPEDDIENIYQFLKKEKRIVGEFAGGAIGNTLHNYSVLADDMSVVLGAMVENIQVGDYAFRYICSTNSHVNFSHLMPIKGSMGRAICFVTEDQERSFAIGKGIMNELSADFIQPNLIQNSAALLISTYLLRDHQAPIFHATMKAVDIANQHHIPVVLSLGTSSILAQNLDFFKEFIGKKVNIVACNHEEAKVLWSEPDPLLCCEKALEFCDTILLTVGAQGLYLAAYCDQMYLRETKDQIHSKSLPEYNRYEYSRVQLKKDTQNPVKIYTHINPFLGGPKKVKNTNGAGDAALAAILHDLSANIYHQKTVPNSPKHISKFLTYSSIHQISKYANRVSFEVLRQNSPRLTKALPEKEDNLEESYWAT